MSAAKHGIVRWLAPRVAYAYLRLCRLTMRLEHDENGMNMHYILHRQGSVPAKPN